MVPNMNKTSIVGEQGMLWNYPDTSIAKPCTECTIVRQWAGLELPDGTNANIDKGLWLHHMVQLTTGSGRWDPTCYGKASLPHTDVNASPSNSERYFSSGNERTIVSLDSIGAATKWGYHLKASDRYAFIVDLMNMNMQDKTVWLTMYYDIVDGPLPSGWEDIKTVWFDVNQCGTSEVRPPKQSGSFTITSGRWTPNFGGRIIAIGGHLHDGGIAVDVNYGPGKAFCSCKAKYAEKPEYIQAPGSGHGSGAHLAVIKHISSMSQCDVGLGNLPINKLEKSQSWFVEGKYDYSQFEGMKDPNGRQSEIMAISLMYIAIRPGTTINSFF
jgi:hypothetical protein